MFIIFLFLVPFLPKSSAICSLSGNSFIKTFDDQYYEFPGHCTYQLTADCVDDTFAVHSYLDPDCRHDFCRRSVNLYLGDIEINLRQSFSVVVNNVTVSLPYVMKNLVIRKIVGYLMVDGWKGLSLRWDGVSSLYVELSPTFANKTCGLCGNFNGNSKDDFTGPSGEVKNTVLSFGASWKRLQFGETCSYYPNVQYSQLDSGNKKRSASVCNVLNSNSFAACHKTIKRDPYIQQCEADLSRCNVLSNVDCICDSLTQYSRACAAKKVVLNWRNKNLCRK